MEQIISLATGAVCRPWSPIKLPKQLKTSGLVEIIKKNIKRGKTRKDYVLVYEYLYILAKHAHKLQIIKEFGQHQQRLATKIHVLAKGNRWIMPYLNNVPLTKWRKVTITEIVAKRGQLMKVLGGARTCVGEDLRDVSQPAVDPQQYAAAETPIVTSPDDATPQGSHITQNHVTWDWTNDTHAGTPFEMTLGEVMGMADSLTENDWSEWNLGESSGTFRNTPESAKI